MAAIVGSDGTVRQLDGRAEPEVVVQEADVQDATKLARMLAWLLREVATLRRRFYPRRIDFEDVVSTGSAGSPATIRLEHGFGGRVRWWVVDVTAPGVIAVPYIYNDTTQTDANTLVLKVYYPSTITIRIEEVG
jgi:hypothetical protein